MKKTVQFLGMLLIALTVMVSCKKDTDPADRDFFVAKVGDSYNFIFGNNIPDINGVKFEKKDDNTYVSIGSGLTGITVTASSLNLLVVKDGQTWTANANR